MTGRQRQHDAKHGAAHQTGHRAFTRLLRTHARRERGLPDGPTDEVGRAVADPAQAEQGHDPEGTLGSLAQRGVELHQATDV